MVTSKSSTTARVCFWSPARLPADLLSSHQLPPLSVLQVLVPICSAGFPAIGALLPLPLPTHKTFCLPLSTQTGPSLFTVTITITTCTYYPPSVTTSSLIPPILFELSANGKHRHVSYDLHIHQHNGVIYILGFTFMFYGIQSPSAGIDKRDLITKRKHRSFVTRSIHRLRSCQTPLLSLSQLSGYTFTMQQLAPCSFLNLLSLPVFTSSCYSLRAKKG
jgi:hypothetical protein